jgi:hypothetical protein
MSFDHLSSDDKPGADAGSVFVHPSRLHMPRRHLMSLGVKAAGVVGLASYGLFTTTSSAYAMILNNSPTGAGDPSLQKLAVSLNNAYHFQDIMMDLYASGSTLRLSQSYADQSGLLSTAFIYDNALTIIAYLKHPAGIARAKLLGDALLYAQQHDPFNDGRLRQAYFVDPFILADGSVHLVEDPFYFLGSAVGDLAWSGLALAHLFVSTGEQKYLEGALGLANWIYKNTYDTRGPGGYHFGVDAAQNPSLVKSTEHNIDTYAFFRLLAKLTRDEAWKQRAEHALDFIQAMWSRQEGHFWTGSQADGVTINTSPVPEDVQTWSYLALRDERYASSLDWAVKHLTTTDTAQAPNSTVVGDQRFTGVTFSDVSLAFPPVNAPGYGPALDPNAVWFEGTAHLITALLYREKSDRHESALRYLKNIQKAQVALGKGQTGNGIAIPEGLGIVASSSPLNTGFFFGYYPNLHIGATAWFCMAGLRLNPYI